MKSLVSTVCLCLFVFGTALTYAQGDKVVIEKNGKQFFVHTVEQGHTLYGISKLYNTSVEAIEGENPSVQDGLSIGETLYIPVPETHDGGEWTNPVRIEDGFMIHRVKRKETLFGISRQYRCDINRILELNPEAELALKPGLELRIPQNDLESTVTEVIEPEANDQWKKHTVVAGETLYGISRKHGVSPEEIEALNGGLLEGLKAGEEILIPVKDELFVQQTQERSFQLELQDTVFIKSHYNVVIMLPLYLETMMTEEDDPRSERLREISMSFYRGIESALDSLRISGANLNVSLLDVNAETDFDRLLARQDVKDAHLIIGPLQRTAIEKVSAYAARKGVHVVCPVPQSNKVLLSNPNLSKVYPSSASEMKALAVFVAKHHAGENIILINSMNVRDARMVQLFKKHYDEALKELPSMTMRGYVEMEGSNKFVGDLKEKLSTTRRNIIIVPAGDESRSMIANLQSKIQLLKEDHEFLIYAPSEWLDYEFLDVSYKNLTTLTIPTAQFVDYSKPDVALFTEGYQRKYKTDPTDYAFMGYDVMSYYGHGLLQFGINFPNRFIDIDRSSLLAIQFDFKKTGSESGYENEHVYLLRHISFELQDVTNEGAPTDR